MKKLIFTVLVTLIVTAGTAIANEKFIWAEGQDVYVTDEVVQSIRDTRTFEPYDPNGSVLVAHHHNGWLVLGKANVSGEPLMAKKVGDNWVLPGMRGKRCQLTQVVNMDMEDPYFDRNLKWAKLELFRLGTATDGLAPGEKGWVIFVE